MGPEAPSFIAVVAARKTITLMKRAGSLRLYARWFDATGRDSAELFVESLSTTKLQLLTARQGWLSRVRSISPVASSKPARKRQLADRGLEASSSSC